MFFRKLRITDQTRQMFQKFVIIQKLKFAPQVTFFAFFHGKVVVIKLLKAKTNLSASNSQN